MNWICIIYSRIKIFSDLWQLCVDTWISCCHSFQQLDCCPYESLSRVYRLLYSSAQLRQCCKCISSLLTAFKTDFVSNCMFSRFSLNKQNWKPRKTSRYRIGWLTLESIRWQSSVCLLHYFSYNFPIYFLWHFFPVNFAHFSCLT